jgi:hypothetical protein
MIEYHKIETLFERDIEGTKKLIEGKFRNECVEYLKDNQWIFTEKIDGTNIRIYWDGHKVKIGGRTDNAQLPGDLVQYLYGLFMTNEAEQLFEQKFGATEVHLFGEGYGGSIQAGGAYSKEKKFIMFDVMVGNTFLQRENIEEIAKAFGVNTVPIVLEGTLQAAIDYVKTRPNSMITSEIKESEGVVGVPKARLTDFRGNRIIVKIKVCDFKN